MDTGIEERTETELHLPSLEHFVPRMVHICYTRPVFNSMVFLNKSKLVAQFIRDSFPEANLMYREYFWVICLNTASRVLGVSLIGKGHDRAVCASVKEILQLAFLTHAGAVIVAHNHPSGNLEPSPTDRAHTKNLKQALKYIGVELQDHIILSQESYFSMADEEMI